jgi:hypothetical protein
MYKVTVQIFYSTGYMVAIHKTNYESEYHYLGEGALLSESLRLIMFALWG